MLKDLALDIILLIPVDKLRWVQRNEGEGSADKLFTQAMHFARSVKSEQYPAAANLFILLTLCPSLEFLNGKYEETIVRQVMSLFLRPVSRIFPFNFEMPEIWEAEISS